MKRPLAYTLLNFIYKASLPLLCHILLVSQCYLSITWFMCQKTFDGKKPYGFLKSVLAYLVRPKLTYAGKPVKLEKEYPAQPITAVRSDIYGISD
ncbi:hypothetical protein C4T40_08670 [Clostridioides difficile]